MLRPAARCAGPFSKRPKNIIRAQIVNFSLVGKTVFEVNQQFSHWLSQVVRLYKGGEDIEFEWLITGIPIRYVSRYLSLSFWISFRSSSKFSDRTGKVVLIQGYFFFVFVRSVNDYRSAVIGLAWRLWQNTRQTSPRTTSFTRIRTVVAGKNGFAIRESTGIWRLQTNPYRAIITR